MSGVFRREHYLVTRLTTGPQDVLLMLDLQKERIDDPYVSSISVCPVYGRPSDDTVRLAVLRGTDEANTKFSTNWHPIEVRFSYSGYDNANCRLLSWAAFFIVEALVNGTVAVAQSNPA